MTKLKTRDVAVVIFYDNRGNIAVQRRGSHSKIGEKYGLWGGKKEDGESPEQAIKRELQEELNFVPQDLKFWTNFTYVVDIEGIYKDWVINHDIFVAPINQQLLKAQVSEGDAVEIMSLEQAINEADFRLIKPLLEKFKDEYAN
jgi:mutator protein MutT